jgi:hypothetical protein
MDFYGSQNGSFLGLVKVLSYTIKMHLKNLAKMPQNTENINFNLPNCEKITLKT